MPLNLKDFANGIAQNAGWDLIKTTASLLLPVGAWLFSLPWWVVVLLAALAFVLTVAVLRHRVRRVDPIGHATDPSVRRDLESKARQEASASFRARGEARANEDAEDVLVTLLDAPGYLGIVVPLTSNNHQRFLRVHEIDFRAATDPEIADRYLAGLESLIARGHVEWHGAHGAFRLTGRGAMAAREVVDRRQRHRVSDERMIAMLRRNGLGADSRALETMEKLKRGESLDLRAAR